MDFRRIPLSKVLLDESFSVSFPLSVELLQKSIKEKGILNPPLLRKKGNFFEVICGKRRIFVSKILGWNSVWSRVVVVSKKEGVLINIYDNLHRFLNSQEKINAVWGLHFICKVSFKDIASKFSSLLNLPPDPLYLRKISLLYGVEEEFKHLLSKEAISMDTVLRLIKIPSPYRKKIAHLLNTLGFGKNKNERLSQFLLRALRKRSYEYIFRYLDKFVKDVKLSPKDKYLKSVEFLSEIIAPTYKKTKDTIKSLLSKLDLEDIRIDFPQNLEAKTLTFSFNCSSTEDFIKICSQMNNISIDILKKIFKIL